MERALAFAVLKAERARERQTYWSSHREAGGGAPCNRSEDCSSNGECRPLTLVLNRTHPTQRGGGGGGGGGATWPSSVCDCHEGFSGARCGYALFGKLRSGGGACNATTTCGGDSSLLPPAPSPAPTLTLTLPRPHPGAAATAATAYGSGASVRKAG